MPKQKLIIVTILITLFLILGYVFYVFYAQEKSEDESLELTPSAKTRVISYERQGGVTNLKEEMNITLLNGFLEGKVEYKLEQNGNKYFRTARISKKNEAAFEAVFDDNNFLSFEDYYSSPTPIADAIKTIITFKDKRVIIEDEEAEIPEGLEAVKQELAKNAEWFQSLLPSLEFTKDQGECGLEKGDGSADIKLEKNDIVFTGKINTPTPCYELSANLETSQDIFNPQEGIITIEINSSSNPKEACVQCTGVVGFSGNIFNLSGMAKYKVIIKSKGIIIGEKELRHWIPFFNNN